MPEMEYQELEDITEDFKRGLKYGRLSEAVTALEILTVYIDGLVKEEVRWRETEINIIEERKRDGV